jgi:hypothetical protein
MGGSEMKSKGTITRARETVLAAGKSAAERTKVLAGEVANAAAMAGTTAKAASTALIRGCRCPPAAPFIEFMAPHILFLGVPGLGDNAT